MNKIITHLDLDLASSNEYKVINAQQLDNNTRRLEVNLFHEGKIYDITNVTKIELQGFRGDGETIKTPLTNDGNNIIIDFDNTILGAKGVCKLKIALFGEDNKLLSSFPFVIRIDQNVYDETGVIASPVYLELENELKNIEDLKSEIETKLDDNYFVLKKDKDVAGGVPSLDSNTKVPITELYEATTTRKGITQLTDSVTSTSTTTAATPNSVKSVNDSLNSEISRAKSAEKTNSDAISSETARATAKENEIANNLSSHTSNTSNPHSVTKSQVGLGNVENKSSATIRNEITSTNVTTALGYTPLNQSLKGSADGLAELDSNGKVPSSQLPSYVDDVIEGYLSGGKFYKESAHTTEISGESGKIYIDLSTEKTYRWSGSTFVVISETLALGETSSTAYRGDRGKIAYDHSQTAHAPSNAQQNVQSDWNATSGDAFIKNKPKIPTKVGELTNDKDYATKTDVSKAIDDIGYGEVAGGKNLVKSYQSSETADKYYIALQADVKLKPSTTYTISFIGTKNNLIYGNEDIFNNPVLNISCTGERQSITMTTLSTISELDSQFKIIFKNYQGNTVIPNFTDVQIEEGSVATEYEPYFPSNKMLAEEKADKSETTVNLLKPTLGTVTQNGVTCTNNGDGTYTLNGTNSSSTPINFLIGSVTIINEGGYKLVGCPTNKSTENHIHIYLHNDDYSIVLNDFGNDNGEANNTILPSGVYYIRIEVIENETVNDIFKPMLTTNLNATYDDFVPYTGSTGQINSDVAEVRKDFDEHTHEITDVTGLQSTLAKKADKEKYGDTVVSVGRKADTTIGENSFAFGKDTTASGYCSHAEGEGTIASAKCQHVQGAYNIEDTEGKYAFIVGNGTSDTNRSNAFTVDKEGISWSKKDVKAGDVSLVGLKNDLDEKIGDYHLDFGYKSKSEVAIVANKTITVSSNTFTWKTENDKTFMCTSNNPFSDVWNPTDAPDICGIIFKVVWDGTEYILLGHERDRLYAQGIDEQYLFGNTSLLGYSNSSDDDTIPFLVVVGRWGNTNADQKSLKILTNDTSSASHTISISRIEMDYKKIPPYYLDTLHKSSKLIHKGSGQCGIVIGMATDASGEGSVAEGECTITSGYASHAEGEQSTASGEASHAEGAITTASGTASHAEGLKTTASGVISHAEGAGTTSSGHQSHAEGEKTIASGNDSHAEGNKSIASGVSSHAEGQRSNAMGAISHAEGASEKALPDTITSSTTNDDVISAWNTTKFSLAKGVCSHTEGLSCLSLGNSSHAEGYRTIAKSIYSHAEGDTTKAMGDYSHAEGRSTTALANQHAQGHYNSTTTATANSTEGTSTGTAFVIGNGTSSSPSNAFRVTGEGVIYATNAAVQTGADYAEYFEWSDGNPDNEDRVGLFVTFDEDNPEKIRIANSNDDYILGIVSGMPSVIGNGDEDWKKRYVLDDFGRYIQETFEYMENDETKIGTKWKENPEYDNTKPYAPRAERAEWSTIGLVGVLSVYDDGTCQVNGYCKCKNNGIATAAEKGVDTYRVIKRVNDNIVKVVLK